MKTFDQRVTYSFGVEAAPEGCRFAFIEDVRCTPVHSIEDDGAHLGAPVRTGADDQGCYLLPRRSRLFVNTFLLVTLVNRRHNPLCI